MFRIIAIGAVLLVVSMLLLACTGKRPTNPGVSDSGLAPCPSSPNCVSSDARDSNHKVPPFRLDARPGEAWKVARELVLELPRVHIVKESSDYIHAECRSHLLGFVDDLELQLRSAEGIIAVRSASRMGYSDFGVNRRRVEALRASLISRGIIQRISPP